MSILNPTCPQGCSTVLPSVDFDLCDPAIFFGEITHLYVAAGDAAPFTDVEDLAEWTARVSETSVDPDAIRDFHVMADLPAATADEIIISLNRKVYSPATHIINIDIDETSDLNYEFARMTSCNTQYRLWFGTADHIYGGQNGILSSLNLRPVIERGSKSINKLTGTAQWDYQFSPERHDNPYATT